MLGLAAVKKQTSTRFTVLLCLSISPIRVKSLFTSGSLLPRPTNKTMESSLIGILVSANRSNKGSIIFSCTPIGCPSFTSTSGNATVGWLIHLEYQFLHVLQSKGEWV